MTEIEKKIGTNVWLW